MFEVGTLRVFATDAESVDADYDDQFKSYASHDQNTAWS
jgi:hypothetical protein